MINKKRAVLAVLFLMSRDFTIHFFLFQILQIFYSGLENNKLESGGSRVIVKDFNIFILTCYADCRCCGGFQAK